MDWNPSILNFTEAKYSEYDEWLGKLVAEIILQNMLYTPLRSLINPPMIYYSVLALYILRNQRHPISALNIFVGSCTPSPKLYQ